MAMFDLAGQTRAAFFGLAGGGDPQVGVGGQPPGVSQAAAGCQLVERILKEFDFGHIASYFSLRLFLGLFLEWAACLVGGRGASSGK